MAESPTFSSVSIIIPAVSYRVENSTTAAQHGMGSKIFRAVDNIKIFLVDSGDRMLW